MLNIVSSILAPQVAAETNAYESIATTVLSTGAASVTFSSIVGTYTHLQIRYIARDERAITAGNAVYAGFNSDTTSTNYRAHQVYGTGASAAAEAIAGNTRGAYAGVSAGNSNGANIFSGVVIDILDYSNTSKNKTIRTLWGIDNNGSGEVGFASGLWMSTAAITSITLKNGTDNLFKQYSSFALYGIKG
jgi:hypothetical protein